MIERPDPDEPRSTHHADTRLVDPFRSALGSTGLTRSGDRSLKSRPEVARFDHTIGASAWTVRVAYVSPTELDSPPTLTLPGPTRALPRRTGWCGALRDPRAARRHLQRPSFARLQLP